MSNQMENENDQSLESECNSSLNSSNPSPYMKRKRPCVSEIWQFFTVEHTQNNEKRVTCKVCGIVYTNPSGTSTLRKHCQKHEITSIQQVNQPNSLSSIKSEELTNAIVTWVIDSMQSFRSIENDKFIEMLHAFDSRYTPPKRATIRRRILERHELLKPAIKQYLDTQTCRFAMTTDAWSSCILKGYIAITLHWINEKWELQSLLLEFKYFPAPHTGQAMCDLMYDLFEQWNLHKRVIAITSDNGANVILGLRKLRNMINDVHGMNTIREDWNIRCLAHTIQLGVKEALKYIKPELEKIRCLLITAKSGVKLQAFNLFKVQLGFRANKHLPLLDTPTRWSSTFVMVSECIILKTVFTALCNSPELGLKDLILDDSEWVKLNSVSTFLEKCANITRIQSAKDSPTLSMIPAAYKLLQNHCNSFIKSEDIVQLAAETMLSKFKSYNHIIISDIVLLARLIDPRFPSDIQMKEKLIQVLTDLYKYNPNIISESEATPDDIFDIDEGVNCENGYTEVDDFFHFTAKRDKTTDPIQWWVNASLRFPTISKFARDVLCIQATSVASESVFSDSGQLIQSRRACMADETIEASMLCRSCVRFVSVCDIH